MTELRAVVRTVVRVRPESSEASTAHFAARVRSLAAVVLGITDFLAEATIFGGELVGKPLAPWTNTLMLSCSVLPLF